MKQSFGVFYLFLLLFVQVSPTLIYSQNNSTEELRAKLSEDSEDSTRINLLNDLASDLLFSSELVKGFSSAESALILSQENNYNPGIGAAFANIGVYYHYLNKYSNALKFYKRSYDVYERIHDTCLMASQSNNIGKVYFDISEYDSALYYYSRANMFLIHQDDSITLASTCNNMGILYNSKGDIKSALDYLNRALNIADCISDSMEMLKANCNLGMVYCSIEDYEIALIHLEKAMDLGKQFSADRSVIDCYIQLGILYSATSNYKYVIDNYNKGLALAMHLKDEMKTARCLHYLGQVYFETGEFELALDHLYKSLEIRQNIEDNTGIVETVNEIAKVFIDFSHLKTSSNPNKVVKNYGNVDGIIELLNESAELSKMSGNIQSLLSTYSSLVLIHADCKQYNQAALYQEIFISLNDSLHFLNKDNELIEIKTRFEAEQKEQQIELLHANNTAQMLKMKRHDKQRYIYLGGGITMVIFVIGLLSRINFIRKTRNELQTKNNQIEREKLRAEESEKIREQFLSKMSYEIRTPMNSVMGIADVLLNNEHTPKQKKYLKAVKQSSENLLVIINDILDLSKLESGELVLENSEFILKEEINYVIEILKYKAEEKQLTFQNQLDQNLPKVLIGDKARLNQILINLVGNAIKFTEKGDIIIKTSLVDSRKDSVEILFEVKDEGIGIPEKKLSKIFESFTQAEVDTGKKYGGTGLGLAISKHLVLMQGGHISARSEFGIGSTFFFQLPYQIGISINKKVNTNGMNKLPGGISVLIVEDNEFNAMVAKDALNTLVKDVKTTIAENGHKALVLVKNFDFDLILLDIQMPVMDGFDTAKYIRNLKTSKKDVPILAMTAYVEKEEIDKCLELGMNDVITKPFNTEDLAAKIVNVLS